MPKLVPGVVSLLDVKPTLLQLLHVAMKAADGHSLAPLIQGKQAVVTDRHIFLESDYSPASIRTLHPEIHQVLYEGARLFQINPSDTRLTVKDAMMSMIIESKQYADIYGEWMLALYPQQHAWQMPILVNLRTGVWTNNLHSSFAKKSPAHLMLNQLKAFYKNEIKDVH
jgi:hypothetical protein